MVKQRSLKVLLKLLNRRFWILFLLFNTQLKSQVGLFYDGLNEDCYLNPSNTLLEKESTIKLKYQNDYPDIDDSFNLIYFDIAYKTSKLWSVNFQLLNDYQTRNQNELDLRFGTGKRFAYKNFHLDASVLFNYNSYRVVIDPSSQAVGELDWGDSNQRNWDLPIGLNLSYLINRNDSLNESSITAGYFRLNTFEPDNSSIASGSSRKPMIQGYSLAFKRYYQIEKNIFETSVFSTYLFSRISWIYNIGVEQLYQINEDKNLAIAFNYFSNGTTGISFILSIKNIEVNLSKGMNIISNTQYLSNPYSALGLKLKL